jgi:hypothetical protein
MAARVDRAAIPTRSLPSAGSGASSSTSCRPDNLMRPAAGGGRSARAARWFGSSQVTNLQVTNRRWRLGPTDLQRSLPALPVCRSAFARRSPAESAVFPAAALLPASAGQLDHGSVRTQRPCLDDPKHWHQIPAWAPPSEASPFGKDRHQWAWALQPEGLIPLRPS